MFDKSYDDVKSQFDKTTVSFSPGMITSNSLMIPKKQEFNFKRSSIYNIKSVANLAGKLDQLQGSGISPGHSRFSQTSKRVSLIGRKSIVKPTIIADAKARVFQNENEIKKKIMMSFEIEQNPMKTIEGFMNGLVHKKIDHLALVAKDQERDFLQRMYEKEQQELKKEEEDAMNEELKKRGATTAGGALKLKSKDENVRKYLI